MIIVNFPLVQNQYYVPIVAYWIWAKSDDYLRATNGLSLIDYTPEAIKKAFIEMINEHNEKVYNKLNPPRNESN
jgi:hypothetical protein